MNIQKNGINLLLVLEVLLLVAVLALGLVGGAAGFLKDVTGGDTQGGYVQNSEPDSDTEDSTKEDTQAPDAEDKPVTEPQRWTVPENYTEQRLEFSAAIESKLAAMTVEQKVAQLFIVTPEALTGYNQVTAFGNASKQAFRQHPVGGLVYNQPNFQGTEQVAALLQAAKTYSEQQFGMTLFTAIEEEGGEKYSPLASKLNLAITASPSALAGQGIDVAKQVVNTRVTYVKNEQFNLMLSTMAEVSPAMDSEYRLRTYGTDAAKVAELVSEEVKLIESAGINSTLKYFPGKADAVNVGTGIYKSDLTMEQYSQGSFVSYQAGIDAGASFVMVSHILAKSITGDGNMPCCLSARTVGLLRESMKFNGVLITESFSDPAFEAEYGSADASVTAIVAGMDMIYMPANFIEAYNAVLAAAKDGTITADRLNNAVGRILTAKGL